MIATKALSSRKELQKGKHANESAEGVHTLFKDCAHHSLKTAHVVLKTARELKTARSIWKYPETLEYRTKYNQPFRKYNKQTVSRTHFKTIISMKFNFQKIIFGVNFDEQNNRNKGNT